MSLIEAIFGVNGIGMYLLIAVVMSYMSATNAWVETEVRKSVGASYANPTLARLSAFGGFASWACLIPAAYFYTVSDYEQTFWDGLIFCAVGLVGGAFIAAMVTSRRLRYLLSPLVLFVNPALTVLVYVMSSQ
jgi:hypothetical protein